MSEDNRILHLPCLVYIVVGLHLSTVFKCHQVYLSCLVLLVNRPCSVTNTKCRPTIICHFLLKQKWALMYD